MGTTVHKLAGVHPDANIDEGCTIGPFCTVGPDVSIGAGTELISHVVIDGHTTIGTDCIVYPFASIGMQSQDLKYVAGDVTYCSLGDRNIVREYVSIHSATEAGTRTAIGSDCALLAHAHVGHNCIVGNHVIMSHAATLGGHVNVGDRANLGGLCAVHQFCNVGEYAMVGGMSRVVKDVLPYMIVVGDPAVTRSVNKIGMQRGDLSDEVIKDIQEVYLKLYHRDLLWADATAKVKEEMGHLPHVRSLIDAVDSSERGIAHPDKSK